MSGSAAERLVVGPTTLVPILIPIYTLQKKLRNATLIDYISFILDFYSSS